MKDYDRNQLIVLAVVAGFVAVFFVFQWRMARESGPLFSGEARESGAVVRVQVQGELVKSGVYEMAPGSTVRDALKAAGSSVSEVDVPGSWLDLAVLDGTSLQLWRDEQGVLQIARGSIDGATMGLFFMRLDLNEATQEDLESLPGVGPSTASSIIAYREDKGGFSSIDELIEVKGIGQRTLERLKPHVKVGAKHAPAEQRSP